MIGHGIINEHRHVSKDDSLTANLPDEAEYSEKYLDSSAALETRRSMG